MRIDGAAVSRWGVVTSDYLDGTIGLEEFAAQSNGIFGTSIDVPTTAIETAVQGTHTAAEAYALREDASLKAAAVICFPPTMDPEQLLPADDPLRARQHELEATLSIGRTHRWLCLSQLEKARIRMGALLSMHREDAERRNLYFTVLFDVRYRWLTGLPPDELPSSTEDALRAFLAWTASAAEST